jgi:hypothetical protein
MVVKNLEHLEINENSSFWLSKILNILKIAALGGPMVAKVLKILKIIAFGDPMVVKNCEHLELAALGHPMVVKNLENLGNLENTGVGLSTILNIL